MNSSIGQKIKEKLSKKELIIGTHIQIGYPVISEILCNCGFDFIWIDWEHGPFDRKEIDFNIMVMRSKGVAPFVRVPGNDPIIVKPILDMGPSAIIFPFVQTVDDAEKAVASCKYPPKGIRGFSPIRAKNYSSMDDEEYLEISKEEPWVILQIESLDAVNNLKKIIKVDNTNLIIVGILDLSASIGLVGQVRHPKVLALCDKIAYICNESNFPFGSSIGWSEENVSDWIKRGVNLIAVDSDISYLFGGGVRTFENVHSLWINKKNLKNK